MKVFYFLLASLFFLFTSRDIIRDLPYNIYQIEDMNEYETKYLPEGNKFYIRFPSNLDKDITFHLTIPKDTTLFPIYSSDFSKYPSDDEIIKAEYQNEIQLKNREDEEYSIYSFDIKKTNSYKVLYFQNNEVLNYLSFYASSLGSTIKIIDREVPYDKRTVLGRLNETTQYFVRVQLDPDDEKLAIETKTNYHDHPAYSLGAAFFSQKPTDDELANELKYELELPYDSTTYSGSETRTFYTKNKAKSTYLGILIDNNKYLRSFEIIVGPDSKIIDREVPYDKRTVLGRLNETTQYFVRVQLDPDDEKLAIETKTNYHDHPAYSLGAAFFSQKPTDDELANELKYELELPYDSTTYSGSETRTFYTKNKAKSTYLGILIDNNEYLRSFEIIVGPDSRWPTWLIAVISVVAGLIIIVFLFFCLRTEGGRAACLCVLGICLICCSNSGRRH